MFMMNIESKQQHQLGDGQLMKIHPQEVDHMEEDEDDMPTWDNTDDERAIHSDTDDDREDEYEHDPMSALRDLNQTLEEAQEMDVSQSLDTSMLSMTATKQDFDLSSSFASPTRQPGPNVRLAQSFSERRSSPFLEERSGSAARRIISSRTSQANGSPSTDNFLSGDSGGIEDAWFSAAKFTDPAFKSEFEKYLAKSISCFASHSFMEI